MGTVFAEITLKNVADRVRVLDGHLNEQDIRSVTVTAIVDTGAMSLVITKDLCKEIGLTIVGEKTVLIANGQRVSCKVTEPVEINWKNRSSSLQAVVIPGAEKILLGVIPLEDMDLIVNPVTQELVGAHGDKVECFALCGITASPAA